MSAVAQSKLDVQNFWVLPATSLMESTWTGLMHQILKYVYENEHQLDRSKENNGKYTSKVKVMSTRCHVMSCLNYIYIFGPV